jgi:hypothetical protein
MRIDSLDDDKVAIVLSPKKAAALLAALKVHAATLGETAVQLAKRLEEEAGVTVPPPEPVRYEYRPPDDW